MPRTLNRLKPLTVERTKTSGRYADGGGLYLVVKPGPRTSWAFIYRRRSKMTELGLGGVSNVPLLAAREEAAEQRLVLSQGGDAKTHRERRRQARALEDGVLASLHVPKMPLAQPPPRDSRFGSPLSYPASIGCGHRWSWK